MLKLSLMLIGSACCIAACGAASDNQVPAPAALVLRPSFEEFQKLRGQWRGLEAGSRVEWTYSFDDTYMVVARSAGGEWYQGMAGLHYELGRAADGTIRVPPGSGVLDVDVFGSRPKEFDGKTSLGAYYLTSPSELKFCASRPGVHLRALSYDASSPSMQCFRLKKISDEPVATQPLPIEREDTARE